MDASVFQKREFFLLIIRRIGSGSVSGAGFVFQKGVFMQFEKFIFKIVWDNFV